MKSYLNEQKEQKIKDLTNAKQLLAKINSLETINDTVDSNVKEVRTLVDSTFLSDNKNKISKNASEINNGCMDRVNLAKTYTNNLITKIQKQIEEIYNQIISIEKEEDKKRKEELQKRNITPGSI